jgi:hypothetical protein
MLAGAYEGSSLAGPAYGDDAARLAGALERAREHLGDERFEARYRRGLGLSDAKATACAREALAGP